MYHILYRPGPKYIHPGDRIQVHLSKILGLFSSRMRGLMVWCFKRTPHLLIAVGLMVVFPAALFMTWVTWVSVLCMTM